MMLCPACHASNPAENGYCQHCGEKLSATGLAATAEDAIDVLPVSALPVEEVSEHQPHQDPAEGEEEAPDLVSTLIPYKNPRALAAYYCGFFALLPGIGFLVGAGAIVLGIMGLRYASANPQARGGAHAITGIILGVLACFCWNPVVCCLLYIAYVY
jgi:hypothetical protein